MQRIKNESSFSSVLSILWFAHVTCVCVPPKDGRPISKHDSSRSHVEKPPNNVDNQMTREWQVAPRRSVLLVDVLMSLAGILVKWQIRVTGSSSWSTWIASSVKLRPNCSRNTRENPSPLSSTISGRWAGKRNLLWILAVTIVFPIRLK